MGQGLGELTGDKEGGGVQCRPKGGMWAWVGVAVWAATLSGWDGSGSVGVLGWERGRDCREWGLGKGCGGGGQENLDRQKSTRECREWSYAAGVALAGRGGRGNGGSGGERAKPGSRLANRRLGKFRRWAGWVVGTKAGLQGGRKPVGRAK